MWFVYENDYKLIISTPTSWRTKKNIGRSSSSTRISVHYIHIYCMFIYTSQCICYDRLMSTTTTIHDDDDESLANTISIDVTTIWILWWWWLITQWNIGKYEATIYIYIYLTSITTSSNILWIIYVSVYYVEIIEPSNTIGSNAFIYFLRLYIYICILYIRLFIYHSFSNRIYI